MIYFTGEYRHQIAQQDDSLSHPDSTIWVCTETPGETIIEFNKCEL